jgi:hypothetical protein
LCRGGSLGLFRLLRALLWQWRRRRLRRPVKQRVQLLLRLLRAFLWRWRRRLGRSVKQRVQLLLRLLLFEMGIHKWVFGHSIVERTSWCSMILAHWPGACRNGWRRRICIIGSSCNVVIGTDSTNSPGRWPRWRKLCFPFDSMWRWG